MRTPPADGLPLTLTLDAATVAAIAETAADLALARLTAEQANPTPWMTLPEACDVPALVETPRLQAHVSPGNPSHQARRPAALQSH